MATNISVADGTTELVEWMRNALVQNLGPGDLYLSDSPEVSVETGFLVVAGDSLQVSGRPITMLADGGDCDVRWSDRWFRTGL